MTDVSPNADLSRRLEILEDRVSQLVERCPTLAADAAPERKNSSPVEGGPRAVTAAILSSTDLDFLGTRLSALAHPVRLRLVLACLEHASKTSELKALSGMGTTGQIYHHLRQLVHAGWLSSSHRGQYEVSSAAVDALAALLSALTEVTDLNRSG
ncbi:ArsR/SmtB family transcription factor [Streptomyces sp. NPDC058637]|uniref:ArsR/SmtB family transcription factor n=1 Tax=Streptomyces sp. NPDC058637 TaxID=3346569 RepID=UPI00365F8B5C